ncbi:TNF receptor-associated factor 4-like [Antedon mediterranea]|uniref:TNF receptor-associated factor 4-like n=1 Tax=Antedon mediterranea TaxID=105859 RepID=UPI003AF8AD8E
MAEGGSVSSFGKHYNNSGDELSKFGSVYSSTTGSLSSRYSELSRIDMASSDDEEDSAYKSTLDGKPIVFMNPIEEKYRCVSCQQILVFPVLLEDCGHRCCSSCLPQLLRASQKCPIDDQSLTRDRVYVDCVFGQEIDIQKVKCVNHARSCQWTGILGQSKDHLKHCLYVLIECPNVCGASMEKIFMENHLKEDCHKRMITCEFCSKCIFHKDEIYHYNICPNFLVHCPNGCDVNTEYLRHNIDKHLNTNCPLEVIECEFAGFGCTFTSIRSEMRYHMTDNTSMNNHVAMIGEKIVSQKIIIDVHGVNLEDGTDSLQTCVDKVQDLEKMFGSHLVWKINNYAERVQDAKIAKKTTIFSPPFLTGRHGYKLSMSACLNGDGKAKGHFMSVFICICRGKYDALLPFPFTHRVTFFLIDQCEDPQARRNISYSIKPVPCKENRMFLGRPQNERNHSFGTSKFAPLHILNTRDYIRDDIIFLKVRVDHDENMGI